MAGRAGRRLPALAVGPALRSAHGRRVPRHAQGGHRDPEPVERSAGGGSPLMEKAAAAPTGFIAQLRARLAARPDTEHEQGILRLVISSLVFLYLLPDALLQRDTLRLYVMRIHLLLALIIFLRIAYSTT